MFVIRAEDWPYQAGDQAMGLEQAVDRGFRNEIALGVGEDECQLARRQGRLVKGQWESYHRIVNDTFIWPTLYSLRRPSLHRGTSQSGFAQAS